MGSLIRSTPTIGVLTRSFWIEACFADFWTLFFDPLDAAGHCINNQRGMDDHGSAGRTGGHIVDIYWEGVTSGAADADDTSFTPCRFNDRDNTQSSAGLPEVDGTE